MTTGELWLAECPFLDQGLIRPLVATDGQIVLMCDEDGTVWLDPQDVAADRFVQPDAPEWEAGGIRIVPGTTRWAAREDLTAAPWNTISWRDLGAAIRLDDSDPDSGLDPGPENRDADNRGF